jgi:cytochrome P450
MSRDVNQFVNPDDFVPERWERESNKWNPFSNLPFGFGARSSSRDIVNVFKRIHV